MARNFRSGTLEKSIRRWGPRLPSMGNFKRKQHSWQYVTLSETAINRGTGTGVSVTLFDQTDWSASATAENVRSVSIDLVVCQTWTPEVTTLEYDSWMFTQGIWVLDRDQPTTVVADLFAEARALRWNAFARNTGEQPTALGVSPDSRSATWRVRATQRFMRFDEELRYACAFTSAVTGTLSDARLSIFGRLSWETP